MIEKRIVTKEEHLERIKIYNDVYKKMAEAHNPYGDGCASKNIIKFLEDCK